MFDVTKWVVGLPAAERAVLLEDKWLFAAAAVRAAEAELARRVLALPACCGPVIAGSMFLESIHHAYAQTDGTYKWPNSREGDLLRQAKNEIETLLISRAAAGSQVAGTTDKEPT